jgi:Fur family ferric uptake transcriptional regulator
VLFAEEPAGDLSMLLRSVGLRSTAARRAVLSWLVEHPHSSAESVRAGVLPQLGSLSHQGVYDVLRVCVGSGLVRCIRPAGHPALFERRVGDNHHHLVCRRCGRTHDVDCVSGSAPCLAPLWEGQFVVDEAEIVFWGVCSGCAAYGTAQSEWTN